MGRLFKPLQDNEVTAEKIAAGAVGNSELAADAVDAAKIAAGAVGAEMIAIGLHGVGSVCMAWGGINADFVAGTNYAGSGLVSPASLWDSSAVQFSYNTAQTLPGTWMAMGSISTLTNQRAAMTFQRVA